MLCGSSGAAHYYWVEGRLFGLRKSVKSLLSSRIALFYTRFPFTIEGAAKAVMKNLSHKFARRDTLTNLG